MTRTEKEKMVAGELYRADAPDLQADHRAAMAWLVRYNQSLALSAAERRSLLRERFAAVGEECDIRPPFHCDYGFQHHPGHRSLLEFQLRHP